MKGHQIEELQALQESLELKRRQALAEILELQDTGAGATETEKARVKLALIIQELAQGKNNIIALRRQPMGFETLATMKIMNQALQKANNADLKEAIRIRDDAEVKVQVLTARKTNFESQKVTLVAEIGGLKQEISRVLGEGGDPGEINRQIRVKTQEIEDIAAWVEELQKTALPAAETVLSEANITVWKCLLKVADEVKTTFSGQMTDHLAQAAELAHSWEAAIREFFKECRDGRLPAAHTLKLKSDPKRTFFGI